MIFVGGIDAVESYGIRHTTGKIVTFAAQSLSHGLRRDSSLYTREPLSRFCQQCDKLEFDDNLGKADSLNNQPRSMRFALTGVQSVKKLVF